MKRFRVEFQITYHAAAIVLADSEEDAEAMAEKVDACVDLTLEPGMEEDTQYHCGCEPNISVEFVTLLEEGDAAAREITPPEAVIPALLDLALNPKDGFGR